MEESWASDLFRLNKSFIIQRSEQLRKKFTLVYPLLHNLLIKVYFKIMTQFGLPKNKEGLKMELMKLILHC